MAIIAIFFSLFCFVFPSCVFQEVDDHIWPHNSAFYVYFQPAINHYLNVSRVGILSVYDVMDCASTCLRHPSCVAFNLASSLDANKKRWCELLPSTSHDGGANTLGRNVQSYHYSMQNPCPIEPCLHDGTCAPLYRLGTYRCICVPGFTGSKCQTPPLECRQYTVLNETNRHMSYGIGSESDGTLSPGWYRFQASAYSMMLNHCISHHRCQTEITGWLNRAHPTLSQGIVDREVCFNGYYNCCYRKVQIRVRSCDGFYVYELKPSPSWGFRYCATN